MSVVWLWWWYKLIYGHRTSTTMSAPMVVTNTEATVNILGAKTKESQNKTKGDRLTRREREREREIWVAGTNTVRSLFLNGRKIKKKCVRVFVC